MKTYRMQMTKYALLAAALLLGALGARAQEVLWQSCVGGSSVDNANAFEIASDGSYVVVGATQSYDVRGLDKKSPNKDVYVVKMNARGEVVWQKNYGGGLSDEAFAIDKTREGGFIVVGGTDSKEFSKGEKDFYVLRLDALGNKVWEKSFGGPNNDVARAAIALREGGYIIAGETGSPSGDVDDYKGGLDFWVVRLDEDGKLVWQKTFGGLLNDQAYSLVQTRDKRYMVAGPTNSSDGDIDKARGETDALLVKFDENGSKIWSKTYGGNGNDAPFHLARNMSNGMIAMVGTTASTEGDLTGKYGNNDVFFMLLDSDGRVQGKHVYGGTGEDGANSVHPTTYLVESEAQGAPMFQTNYLIAGTSNSRNGNLMAVPGKGGVDAWVFMVDKDGAVRWQQTVGGKKTDVFVSAKEIPGKDFVAIGFTGSSDGDLAQVDRKGSNDMWVCKIKDPYADPQEVITSLTPTTIAGYVRDKETQEFIEAEIKLVQNQKNQNIGNTKSDPKYGTFQIIVPDTNQASIGVFAEGYFFHSQNILIPESKRYSEIQLDVELKPIKKDTILPLFNIHFDSGKWDILDEAKPELDRIVQFLKQNKTIHVKINGHTDASGAPDTKQKLSELRAKAVMNYLIRKGVGGGRLEYEGFGPTKPIASNETEEGKMQNRRVEVQVTQLR